MIVCGVWVGAALIALITGPMLAHAGGDVERGRVIFALAGGCGCHTSKEGPVGAGGEEIATPFGKFFATNITPDPQTGIGNWSDEDIDHALRGGYVRGRGTEAPLMPYYLYAGMADADVADLIAFLRSLKPVQRSNRAHEGEVPMARLAYRAWHLLFAPVAVHRVRAPAAGAERGRYLVDHLAICGDSHTPRNRLGVPIARMYLAGSDVGPGGKSVPNITPHATGIGEWDVDDVVNVLTRGMLPNFDNVQGFMAAMVDGHGGAPGYKDAPAAALRDIAVYVKSVAAIDNDVGGK